MALLNDQGIVARDFRAGSRPGTGDTLILCLSSAPLLGWYRYLKTVLRVTGRYDVRLIVLCPEVVYRSGLVCGINIVAVNGEDELVQLVQVLTQTELNNFQKGDNEDNQKVIWSVFLEKASEILLTSPSSETDVTRARRAYSQRSLMLQYLGFSSLLKLKVFMADGHIFR
ncbi:hypothetical protein [Escherichia coli]|uniref:hypothetical protein n=2 Tax=Escherichia coli TaxID=562 RepID=UPI002076BC29|nr:hypothetical protein [Escherichia coli]